MKIHQTIWKEHLAEKIESKHGVRMEEVEEVLHRWGRVRYVEAGDVEGEDVYAAFGQTGGGRYLVVFFIYKAGGVALPISARLMSARERKTYARQKKTRKD